MPASYQYKSRQYKSRLNSLKKELFFCLIGLTLLAAVLSAFSLLAIPSSRFYVLILAIVTIALGASFDFRETAKAALAALLIVICIYFISLTLDPRERRQEYRSPAGENTIIIEYDHASRPFIYRRENALFMTPVPFDFGPGYNETVNHRVLWLSETQVELTDNDGGQWIVDIGRH